MVFFLIRVYPRSSAVPFFFCNNLSQGVFSMSRTYRFLLTLLAAGLLLPTAQAQRQPARLPVNVVAHRDIEYGKGGDISLKLDVYTPKAEAKKPLPVVVWIHGGGWQGGNKNGGAGRLGSLVASGNYAGVSVGYRLTDKASWPAQIHDCKAAIRWIRANAKKYNFDPNKIGVWGSSAGGHLVAMLGTSGDVKEMEGDNGSPGQSSRVTCVVDFCGPSDFLAFGKESPRMNDPKSPVGKLLGGAIRDKVDVAKSASPVTYVSKDDPPFLIMHGTKDKTVPLAQAEILQSALKKAGVDTTFVAIEGGGHGFGGPEVLERVRGFLDKQLLGKKIEVSSAPIKAPAPKQK
jgi:acetyl esterase/lipase